MRPPPRATLSLPASPLLLNATPTQASHHHHHHHHLPRQQIRHATLIRRPRRPYTFTQLMTLSDGSTYLHRTTSPTPMHRSTRDTRNTPLWNPSNARMANVEEDEAGRLRAFRRRFGRAFDSSTAERGNDGGAGGAAGAPGDGSVDVGSAVGGDAAVPVGAGKEEEGEEELSATSKQERASISGPSSSSGTPSAPSAGPSAAQKTQADADARGQGQGTTASSEWEDGDEDNLMDLISSYSGGEGQGGGAGARVVRRGLPGAAEGVRGKGKGKKGGKGR